MIEYNSLIEELFNRHPSVQNIGFNGSSYKPGLGAITAFDRLLGSPWKQYKIIHIAGTNGKGSVSSMLAASLAGSGYKVGLYTSPHLVDFRERIKIISGNSFELVSKDFVYSFLTGESFGAEVSGADSGLISSALEGLSFFEITTAMAFQYFATEAVDYAVIETGLGGRLDSTNIVSPVLSVITSIALDHCALLGDSIEKIAAEKGGIIKPGVPVVVSGGSGVIDGSVVDGDVVDSGVIAGGCPPEAIKVLSGIAAEKSSPIYYASACDSLDLDLKGSYQSINLGTVVSSLSVLGLEPNLAAISSAARITGFRGRWEIVQSGNPCIICDIGHNPEALKYNFEQLENMGRPLFIVYGVMADKDYRSVRKLMPTCARYYGVAPKSERALKLSLLSEVLEGLSFVVAPSVVEGCRMAIADAALVENSVVYIGGSNFVVAEYLAKFLRV